MKQNWISISESQFVIDEIIKGRLTQYIMPLISGANDDLLLECQDGKPVTCGKDSEHVLSNFPYVFSKNLVFLILEGNGKTCLNYIRSIHAQKANSSICTWEIVFEIEPFRNLISLVSSKTSDAYSFDKHSSKRSCLLIWNPSDGNFTESDYEQYFFERYVLSWFVEAWKNPHKGGICFLLRMGDSKAGVVMIGEFLSDSKEIKNWNYSTFVKYSVDIKCIDMIHQNGITPLPLNKLKEDFGCVDWDNAYSGMEIPNDVSSKLLEIWNKF